MGNKVEVILSINSPSIANLHSTITSILEQLDASHLISCICIYNHCHLDIQSELTRLSYANIKIQNSPKNLRFQLLIKSGTTISKSYLYKATHFLEHNPSTFICPEYTFSKLNDSPIITTIKNHRLLLNCADAIVIDRSKLSSNTSLPRTDIIKNTCSSTPVIELSFSKYLKSLKKSSANLASPYFSPSNLTHQDTSPTYQSTRKYQFKIRLISSIKSISGKSRVIHKLFSFINSWHNDSSSIIKNLKNKTAPYISDAMRNELAWLSSINYSLKGFQTMNYYDITHEFSYSSEKLFSALKNISPSLRHSQYDYVMVLPWLISGGIDLFATNYLKTIAKILPDQHILVILTNNAHKSFTKEELKLPSNIDLLDLPKILPESLFNPKILDELLYSLINIFTPQRLHIIASKVGYDCLIKHGSAIRHNGTKIIFSSYNYLTGNHGEYIGYTVQELPRAYMPGDIITTDNIKSKNLWVKQYGFLENDILIHQQLFDISDLLLTTIPSSHDGIKILWAAHIRPEKNPGILPQIASALQNEHIDIDCYGLFTPDNWPDENNPLVTDLPNLHYLGPFNDFFTDIKLSDYDLFLYTSHADGTPNVIIEAALAGLPIVSSAIGGIPDVTRGKAHLIQDSHSATQFVEAIHDVLSHHKASIKQAKSLKQELEKCHDQQTFTAQVNEMLERSK